MIEAAYICACILIASNGDARQTIGWAVLTLTALAHGLLYFLGPIF